MSGRLYLDANAAAPLRPEARAAMIAAMDLAGNPSSLHAEGRAARAVIERAREDVAEFAGCSPAEVVFTSGATEAAAMALSGAEALCAAVEHECVRAWAREALAIDSQGRISPAAPEGARVARQAANGETGAIQPWGGLVWFMDAAQALGKTAWRFDLCAAQTAAISSPKIGGPKGVGALLMRDGLEIAPLLKGGGQEARRRAGTENLIGIAGFGAAARAARLEREAGAWAETARLRDRWESALKSLAPEAVIFSLEAPRLPNTSCFALPGWAAQTQLMQLDLAGVAVSAGSACSSGNMKPSAVIRAITGREDLGREDLARAAIRVSLGPATTETEIDRFIGLWADLYRRRKPQAA